MKKVIATVEISKNSNIKYEYDRKTGKISVDRILYGAMSYPANYGFLKEALDWDGDELDVLIISDHSFMPGVEVPTRIIGALEMIDAGETDTKLIGVIDVDPRFDNINTLEDLAPVKLEEIKDFFENYKNIQKKKVQIKGFKSIDWALKEYEECVNLMNQYGALEKDDFVNKMKQLHPEKYN